MKKGQSQEFDNEVFLEIVKTAFPQESINKWSQVARKYYLQTGQRILKTQELRRKFEVLTKLDCKYTDEQKLLMYKLDVLARGSKKLGLKMKINRQEEDMSIVIEQKQKKKQQNDQIELHKNKELQVFKKQSGAKVIKAKKKQGEIAKFRGQFLVPGEFKNMDRLTRTFHFEDDSEYDEKEQEVAQLDVEAHEAKTRMQKLQELYQEAFLKIPNQKQQSYYNDR